MFEHLNKSDLIRMLSAASGPRGDLLLNFLDHYGLIGLRYATEGQLREYATLVFDAEYPRCRTESTYALGS